MKKLILATAAAAALTVGATAANAQVFAPWSDDYGYGSNYSEQDDYGYGPNYSQRNAYNYGYGYRFDRAVPGEFVDDARTGLKNGS